MLIFIRASLRAAMRIIRRFKYYFQEQKPSIFSPYWFGRWGKLFFAEDYIGSQGEKFLYMRADK